MFSSNSITDLLGLWDKNLPFTGKIFSEKEQGFKSQGYHRPFMAETPIREKGCSISKGVKDLIIDNLAEIMPMKEIAKNH